MAVDNQVIQCKIQETGIVKCTIDESEIIRVTVEAGGQIEKAWVIIGNYLIQEELTSQINGTKVQFTCTYTIYNSQLKIFVNGLKEKPISISTNKFTLNIAPSIGDSLEVEYIKDGTV